MMTARTQQQHPLRHTRAARLREEAAAATRARARAPPILLYPPAPSPILCPCNTATCPYVRRRCRRRCLAAGGAALPDPPPPAAGLPSSRAQNAPSLKARSVANTIFAPLTAKLLPGANSGHRERARRSLCCSASNKKHARRPPAGAGDRGVGQQDRRGHRFGGWRRPLQPAAHVRAGAAPFCSRCRAPPPAPASPPLRYDPHTTHAGT